MGATNVMSAMIYRRDFEHLVAAVKYLLSNSTAQRRTMDTVIHAVLVAEDRRFMRHSGVDLIALLRAAIKWARGGRLEGASTIEQQLVRTIRGRYELTLGRKCSEIILASRLSRAFPKAELINCYLHIAYFGWRANGIEQAAARLGVDLDACSIEEAAALAAMLKVPMPKVPTARFAQRHSMRVDYIIKNWAAMRD
ncbi:biosynthetic peptidoglycan transglycosylase [Rhizobium sp. SG2393]|uniref:biosynthetic peptidoglycan transglycosylase n=1 Tax=Rhizobium sp. SG2393 TaxID=3276279 RepID=UPI00366B8EA3